MIKFYIGDLNCFTDLLKLSPKLKFMQTSPESSQDSEKKLFEIRKKAWKGLRRLFNNFRKDSLHTFNSNFTWHNFDLSKYILLSPNNETNSRMIIEVLWKLAQSAVDT